MKKFQTNFLLPLFIAFIYIFLLIISCNDKLETDMDIFGSSDNQSDWPPRILNISAHPNEISPLDTTYINCLAIGGSGKIGYTWIAEEGTFLYIRNIWNVVTATIFMALLITGIHYLFIVYWSCWNIYLIVLIFKVVLGGK